MALQASPQPVQSTIPPDAFAVDAPSSRRHYAQRSPQLQDDQHIAGSPQPSRRRPSGGNISQPATPQHRTPNTSHTSSASTARALPTTQPSPRTPTAATSSSQYTRREPQRDLTGPPISPPPRTSSNQRGTPVTSHQEMQVADRTRYRDPIQYGYPGDEDRNIQDVGSTPRSRRDAPLPTNNAVDSRTQPSPASSQHRNGSSSQSRLADMSREGSEVLNRVVVTDPEVDITREQERLAEAIPSGGHARSASMPPVNNDDDSNRVTQRTRQDFSSSASRRKETKFGEYILGQTLGEGEFGKVKLGWKKDGSVQVAIKLIRRENLTANPTRLPKIYREVTILGSLSHPNIVRLHEMVETERYIGIILEYASGGELFDYILTHRYLKDNAARRLFAQLVSGVGYLHKKGIVHRDLKLENLLLDRNRNIIITDFGFANNFDPKDELGEEIEYNLINKDFVKKMDLERIRNGVRRGDLMQTSCGSPCYAAPELVVTDSLYTGRKVDVWSCGVILYAMLAGYLPFDDDPANPEGDNINLLYKYIVSTPLTFPEYVSPHARDLLRRILVPDPRKRADLFEVARHSWLSEYAHVVAHVTSSTTTIGDIANTTVNEDLSEAPLLNRSASVREPTKPYSSNIPAVGGLSHQGKLDTEAEKASRDPKRRTVQVEYVEPKSQTVRGEASPPQVPATALTESDARIKATSESSRKVHAAVATRKPLPQDPPNIATHSGRTPQRINVVQAGMPPPSRPGREPPRSVSDSTGAFAIPPAVIARPNTGGSMSSANGGRLPSRGNSYSQPLAPTVAVTTAQGRLAQPKGARPYNISAPVPQPEPYISDSPQGRPVSQRLPIKTNTGSTDSKGHKRSTTLSNVFGRSGSLFGIKSPASPSEGNKLEKKYPPTSMKSPLASSDSPRQSTDSRRPSIGFGRKNSDLSKQEKPRRFSLLPASFSFKNFTGSKDSDSAKYPDQKLSNTSNTPGQGSSRQSFDSQRYDGVKDPYPQQNRQVSAPVSRQYDRPPKSAPQSSHERYASTQYPSSNSRPLPPGHSYFIGESGPPTDLEASLSRPQQQKPRYPPGFNDDDEQPRLSMQQQRGTRVLQKPNRKFADAWDQDNDRGHHAGTSGAAKRVMDFFRRRGKARSGDER